jgi:hypothetical protein
VRIRLKLLFTLLTEVIVVPDGAFVSNTDNRIHLTAKASRIFVNYRFLLTLFDLLVLLFFIEVVDFAVYDQVAVE